MDVDGCRVEPLAPDRSTISWPCRARVGSAGAGARTGLPRAPRRGVKAPSGEARPQSRPGPRHRRSRTTTGPDRPCGTRSGGLVSRHAPPLASRAGQLPLLHDRSGHRRRRFNCLFRGQETSPRPGPQHSADKGSRRLRRRSGSSDPRGVPWDTSRCTPGTPTRRRLRRPCTPGWRRPLTDWASRSSSAAPRTNP